MNATAKPGKVAVWLQAVRAFSFTASTVPVLLGSVLAYSYQPTINLWLFPLILVCAILLHAATNLISDYYDFKNGLDSEDTYGSSGVLTKGWLQPKSLLRAGILLFATGFLLGLTLVYLRGWPMLILGLIGIFGGYTYCGGIGYKYLGLGDLLVFFLMGPMMVLGTFFAFTGQYNWEVFLISLPIGFLVTAILVANNIRDIRDDLAANVKTVSNMIGMKGAKIEYYALEGLAYLSVIAMVIGGVVSPWALVILLSLPPAVKNIKMISTARRDKPNEIAMIDVQTAQHHFLFGLLLSVGLVLATIF